MLAILGVGDRRDLRAPDREEAPRLLAAPGHGMRAGERLIGRGEVELLHLIRCALNEGKASLCVVEGRLGPPENRVHVRAEPLAAGTIRRRRAGRKRPVERGRVRRIDDGGQRK